MTAPSLPLPVPAMAVAAALLAAAPPTFAAERLFGLEVYVLERTGGGMGYDVDERVVVSRYSAGPRTGPVWVAERQKSERTPLGLSPSLHQWIDAWRCPALKPALDRLALLPMRIAAPDRVSDRPPPTDTPSITLRARPADDPGAGVWLARTEYAGPLAYWWSRTGKALAPCWQPEPVRIDGSETRSRSLQRIAPP